MKLLCSWKVSISVFDGFSNFTGQRFWKTCFDKMSYLCVCDLWHKCYGRIISKTDARNLTKNYLQQVHNITRYWFVFGANLSKHSTPMDHFSQFPQSSISKINARIFMNHQIQLVIKVNLCFMHFAANHSKNHSSMQHLLSFTFFCMKNILLRKYQLMHLKCSLS